MSEEEKECFVVLFKFVLNIKRADIPTTMWKYAKIFMPILEEQNLVESLSTPGTVKYRVPCSLSYIDEDIDILLSQLSLYENIFLWNKYFHSFIKYMKKYLSTPKYIMKGTAHITVNGNSKILYEIFTNKPFISYNNDGKRVVIPKNQQGGWIESEKNLSQEGFCWVDFGSLVSDNAVVLDNAYIGGHSKIVDNAVIKDNTRCHNSYIRENVIISDNSIIKESIIRNNVEIYGKSIVTNSSLIEDVWIENAKICDKYLQGNKKIKNK